MGKTMNQNMYLKKLKELLKLALGKGAVVLRILTSVVKRIASFYRELFTDIKNKPILEKSKAAAAAAVPIVALSIIMLPQSEDQETKVGTNKYTISSIKSEDSSVPANAIDTINTEKEQKKNIKTLIKSQTNCEEKEGFPISVSYCSGVAAFYLDTFEGSKENTSRAKSALKPLGISILAHDKNCGYITQYKSSTPSTYQQFENGQNYIKDIGIRALQSTGSDKEYYLKKVANIHDKCSRVLNHFEKVLISKDR